MLNITTKDSINSHEQPNSDTKSLETRVFEYECIRILKNDDNKIEEGIPISIKNYTCCSHEKNGEISYLQQSLQCTCLTDPVTISANDIIPWNAPRPSYAYEIILEEMKFITHSLFDEVFCCKLDYMYHFNDKTKAITFYVDLRKEFGNPTTFEIFGGIYALKKLLDLSGKRSFYFDDYSCSDDDYSDLDNSVENYKIVTCELKFMTIVHRISLDKYSHIQSEQDYMMCFEETFKIFFLSQSPNCSISSSEHDNF